MTGPAESHLFLLIRCGTDAEKGGSGCDARLGEGGAKIDA